VAFSYIHTNHVLEKLFFDVSAAKLGFGRADNAVPDYLR
jgi:hypothetical protein